MHLHFWWYCAASSLRLIQNPKQQISFGSIVADGNAVLRLEVDEVELISGDWNKTGFSIPVCGEHSTEAEPTHDAIRRHAQTCAVHCTWLHSTHAMR